MNYQEFLKSIDRQEFDDESDCTPLHSRVLDKEEKPLKSFISMHWDMGSRSKSSCSVGEFQPEFDELHKILEIIVPKITYLQCMKLIRECVVAGVDSLHDYYGTSNELGFKYVYCEDLFNYLVKEKLIK